MDKQKILEEHKRQVARNRCCSPTSVKVVIAILAVLLIASIFTFGFREFPQFGAKESIGEKSLDFINSNMLNGNSPAKLNSISEDSCFYKLSLGVDGKEYDSYVSKDGELLFPLVVDMSEGTPPGGNPVETPQESPETAASGDIKTFQTKGNEICKVDGKPVIRLFSTTWCPHCKWIKETFDKVAKEYADSGKAVAYHWEVDTGDNTLTENAEKEVPTAELDVYNKFNPGGSIPTFVFGCKYYRIGNGYEKEKDLAAEEKEFRAIIEDLLKSS